MTPDELEALSAVMADVVQEQVQAAIQPLQERIALLEARQPEKGDPGENGKPGRDGENGKDADPALTRTLIDDVVAAAMASLPKPQDGKSISLEDVRPLVDECVAKGISAIAVPKDGRDGVGVAGAIIDRSGNLVLTLSDGTTRDLGGVVGKDADQAALIQAIEEKIAAIPKPKDGRDGFSLEDFDAEVMNDERTVLLSFASGDFSYKVELCFPVMLYRGVFSAEREYDRGDTVTWAGSLWHCEADKTAEKPGDGSKAWTLAAKRGRDGRDTPVKATNEKPVVKVA